MGFFKNILRNAVNDGISKGIRDAVEKATETILAPKAEEAAGKIADQLDTAVKETENETAEPERNASLSSLEESLNRMADAAERFAEAAEKNVLVQEDLAKKWAEKLPGFPVWCFGGTDFWFDENGTTSDGNPYNLFELEDATEEGLKLYIELLRNNGFVSQHGPDDDTLYKEVGGEYLVFNKTECFNAAPHLSLVMFHTKDRNEFIF